MTNQEIIQQLVEQATTRASRFAMAKIGKYVEVRVDLEVFARGNVVEVSWPSIGSQNAAVTASFALELTQAAEIAQGVERAIRAKNTPDWLTEDGRIVVSGGY